jgi:hypothetical protein
VVTTLPPKEPAVRRSLLLIPLALLLALAAAPAALGGGFATVGLSSTPDGIAPGQPWKVDITVLQHGRTPLEGLTPKVRIHSGSTVHEVVAGPTAKAGVYRASVVFPAAGRWDYEVLDGFINEVPHTFPAVEIGGAGSPAAPAATTAPPAPAPAADSGGGIAAGWLVGAGAALLLALAVLGLGRRRRGHGAMPHTPEPAA